VKADNTDQYDMSIILMVEYRCQTAAFQPKGISASPFVMLSNSGGENACGGPSGLLFLPATNSSPLLWTKTFPGLKEYVKLTKWVGS